MKLAKDVLAGVRARSITRADFENGVEFVYFHSVPGDGVYYVEGCGIRRRIGDGHVCHVEEITDKGFHFSASVFGVRVKGFVEFELCIRVNK